MASDLSLPLAAASGDTAPDNIWIAAQRRDR